MRKLFAAPLIAIAVAATAPANAQATNEAVDANAATDMALPAPEEANAALPADMMAVEPVTTQQPPAYAPTRKTSEGFPWGLLGLVGLVGLLGKARRTSGG